MQAVEADRILRWTMFLHDIGKPPTHSEDENGCDHFYGHVKQSVAMADTILRRLRFDNASREKILTLIAYHDCELPDTELSMRKLLNKIGIPLFPDLWKVQVADMRAQNPTLLEERLEKAEATMELYQRVRNQNPCVCLEDLAVNGWDLIAMGYPPGKAVGLVLRQLLEVVIECPELNQRGILLETAEKLKKKPEIQIYLG
ncbi:MAG: HD domain-containing protein [Clostridia bacterium]